MSVTREEFENWQESPVTRQYRKMIRREIEHLQEMLVNSDSIEQVKLIQGGIKTAVKYVNVEYEDLFNEKEKARMYE